MRIDLEKETLWQEESNATWFTNIMPTCDLCGRKSEHVTEIKVSLEDKGFRVCHLSKTDCLREATALFFGQNPDADYLHMRSINFKQIGKKTRTNKNKRREPVGLSKRYTVLRRDGFQCVLCGKSGKEARLEVDHIIPVTKGGLNSIDNLRTLCFECNRGKGDKTE